MPLEQAVEVRPGLLSHKAPSGAIHQVDANFDTEEGASS
jgi:hypothetical protein